MKKLILDSLASPSGNFFAIVNLSMIALVGSIQFSHVNSLVKFIVLVNSPALAIGFLLKERVVGVLLVYVQWILIARFAKFLAAKLRPPETS